MQNSELIHLINSVDLIDPVVWVAQTDDFLTRSGIECADLSELLARLKRPGDTSRERHILFLFLQRLWRHNVPSYR